MKKVLISAFLIISTFLVKAQVYPISQGLGNTPNTEVITNAFRIKESLVLGTFLDTTAANTKIYLKATDGALIRTINGNIWQRLNNKWILINNQFYTNGYGINLASNQFSADTLSSNGLVTKFKIKSDSSFFENKKEDKKVLQVYENNTAAITAGLRNGDKYYLPYNNGIFQVATVIEFRNIETIWTVFTDNNPLSLTIKTKLTTDTITVFFAADNTTQKLVGSREYFINKSLLLNNSSVFTTAPAYAITSVFIENSQLEEIFNQDALNNLDSIYLYKFNTFDYSFPSFLNLPNKLKTFILFGSRMVDFYPFNSCPPTIKNFNLRNNRLNSLSVNNALFFLNDALINNAFIDLRQQLGYEAPPTGAGITAKNELIARGCTVITN